MNMDRITTVNRTGAALLVAGLLAANWPAVVRAQSVPPPAIRPWLQKLQEVGALDPSKPLWEGTEALKRQVQNPRNVSIYKVSLDDINKGAFFRSPQERTAFLVRLRAAAEEISRRQLEQSGVPRAIAAEIAKDVPRPWLRPLEELALARHAMPRLFQTGTQERLRAVQRRSFMGLLDRNVTRDQLTTVAADVNASTARVPLVAGIQQIAPADTAPIDRILSEKSREWFKGQPRAVQDEVRSQLTAFLKTQLSALAQLEAEVKKRSSDVEEKALEAFALVSGIQKDIAKIGDGVKSAQAGILDPLQKVQDAIDRDWKTVDSRLRQTALDQNLLRYQAQAATVFRDLTSVASLVESAFKDRNSFDRVGHALLASAGVPAEAKTALTAMQTLSNSNASFAGKAEAMLAIGSIVAPNEMKAVQGLLKDVGPVLAAAGPLLALSGFGAPVALGLGALGGGDSGPDPQIMAELGKINAKLDAIISQLAKIEERMIKQHMETMRALEAMHFDVQRLLAINQRQAFEDLFGSCERALDPDNKSTTTEYDTCSKNIWELLTPQGVPIRLAIYSNLRAVEGRTPLDEWRRISAAHAVVFRDADAWCGTLLAGVMPVARLKSALPFEHSEPSKSLCADVADNQKLLEPALLGQLTERELTTARRFVKTLSTDGRARVNLRWRYELRLLNLGVAQQAAFSGFAGIGDAAGVLFHGREVEEFKEADSRKILTDSLKNYVAVAENALRFEMNGRYGMDPGPTALYSFAYLSGDPIHLNETSRIDNAHGRFVWSQQSGSYCFESTILGAERCILPPSPRQLQDGAPKVTAAHQLLVEQRFRVLQLSEEANFLSVLSAQERDRLAELLTLQFMQEQAMEKVRAKTGIPN